MVKVKLKDVKVTASFTYKGKRVNASEYIGYIGLELNKEQEKIFALMIKNSWIEKKEKENLLKRTKQEIALDKLLRSEAIGSWGKRKSPIRKITNCSTECLNGPCNGEADKFYPQTKVVQWLNGEWIN